MICDKELQQKVKKRLTITRMKVRIDTDQDRMLKYLKSRAKIRY